MVKRPKDAADQVLPPGSVQAYEGGPHVHFERSPDSPFDDKYDIDRERKRVQHLIDSEDPDPADPLWDNFQLYEARSSELDAMRAAFSATNAAPRDVTQREARAVSEVGRLVVEESDTMHLHTREAHRMFMGRGRDPEGNAAPIPGGRGLASTLRTLHTKSQTDNPYADWGLVLADQYISVQMEHIDATIQQCRAKLEDEASQGITLHVLQSQRPSQLDLGFKSAYGYRVARLIVKFDYLVRMIKTLNRAGLMSDDEQRKTIGKHQREFRADCLKLIRFERFLADDRMAQLSRSDFLPSADEHALKRKAAALEWFGPVPAEIMTGATKPLHSRRQADLSKQDRDLLEAIAQELEGTDFEALV
ncbi:PFL_4669 family integrating conjugative element protein [Nitrogeniibacter aestuarii]|uniref:PFL_4669 family integrating conjugative element protein n=1 Tax=Nitrogeniibacter aestuarii TaxID=2815343 RepID=UPI001E3DD4DD|nr:TIGR03761 family integrating conjugative element protein [Nitrogeniibacter aestuarii]